MAGPWEEYAQKSPKSDGPWSEYQSAAPKEVKPTGGVVDDLKALFKPVTDTAMGGLKGAANIGATIVGGIEQGAEKLAGKSDSTALKDRRARLDQFFQDNADPESLPFKAGELGAEIAGTAGVGGAISKGFQVAKYAPKLAAAIESGGFALNAPKATTIAGKASDVATRVGGGAVSGGAAAALVDPETADTGAALGGALPVAAKVAGAAGKALAPDVAPKVQALYQRAKDLGIDVPADRIVNSPMLNAGAASLKYMPLSGRAGTEEKMIEQMNRAVSRTFGQDSADVTGALRQAKTDLGGKFDSTLKNNTVKADYQLAKDMADTLTEAGKVLESGPLKIIGNQVDEIIGKVQAGNTIDGKALYSIKKTLDLIGKANDDKAHFAKQLRNNLMDALNRSLGPDEAAAFAKVRKQYGAMKAMEKIAQNGAEGGVSVARLANMKNIGNPELQELADIATQFVKGRESNHGGMQRLAIGGTAGAAAMGAGAVPLLAATLAGGRAANSALNSKALKNAMLNRPQNAAKLNKLLADPMIRNALINQGSQAGQP